MRLASLGAARSRGCVVVGVEDGSLIMETNRRDSNG
jgi:hypothetical protein